MLQLSLRHSALLVGGFFLLHWYSCLFMQSFFYHRYAAHHLFSMSLFWERVFYFFSYVAHGASYLEPSSYAVMHRLHHAHTDTAKDPHSPAFSKNVFTMMERTRVYYEGIRRGKPIEPIDPHYYNQIPRWEAIDKLGSNWYSRISWGLLYLLFYVLVAKWWMFVLLPIHFLMSPVQGSFVNWLAHRVGYVNFPMHNTSKNIIGFDFLLWGEGLHNNHHGNPTGVNFAKRWFEFDAMYPVLQALQALRIIKLKTATA